MRRTFPFFGSLALAVLLGLLLLAACDTPTPPISPIPSPTSPASPLPLPTSTVSILPVPDIPRTFSESGFITDHVLVYWDYPTITDRQTYTAFNSTEPPESYKLFFDYRGYRDGRLVLTKTVDSGVTGADGLGMGVYADVVNDVWQRDELTGVLDVDARMRWSGPPVYYLTGISQIFGLLLPVYESTDEPFEAYGYYVAPDGTIAPRDEEGFSRIGQFYSWRSLYMPLIWRDDQP